MFISLVIMRKSRKIARSLSILCETFEKELPFPDASDLVSNWEFLYERSLGCIGILKQWLVRAATVALHKGKPEADNMQS